MTIVNTIKQILKNLDYICVHLQKQIGKINMKELILYNTLPNILHPSFCMYIHLYPEKVQWQKLQVFREIGR